MTSPSTLLNSVLMSKLRELTSTDTRVDASNHHRKVFKLKSRNLSHGFQSKPSVVPVFVPKMAQNSSQTSKAHSQQDGAKQFASNQQFQFFSVSSVKEF